MSQQISEAKGQTEAPVPRAIRDIDEGLQVLSTEVEGLANRLKPVLLDRGPPVVKETEGDRPQASPLEEALLSMGRQIKAITAEVCRLRMGLQI